MTSEANYYTVLQATIAQAAPDSFEARGAIYDRLWQIILDQLQAKQITSEEDVAVERAAFLRAIQRIEFGGGPPSPEGGVRQPARRGAQSSTGVRLIKPRRRIFWRIAGGMLGACVVLLAAGVFSALIAIRSDSTVAARWTDESAANSWQSQMVRAVISLNNFIERRSVTTPPVAAQRAVLYEESAATATGTTFSGHAVWRHHSKSGGPSAAELSINVEIPQKNLILEITMRRAPEGGVISHFVEFRFLGPNRSLSDAVEDVVGILMKNDELSRGIELVGRVVRVQPGMFLMGLSGAEADVGRNVKLLKDRPWLDIPIVFKGGSRSILAIEKGTTGANALNDAFATWGRGQG